MKWRITTLIVFFGLLFLLLFFNLYNLQLEKRDYYLTRTEAQQEASGVLGAKRGNIYFTDRNDNFIPAALNKNYPIIYAVPKEIRDAFSVTAVLSEIIKKSAGELEKLLSKPDDQYELLISKATSQQVEEVEGLEIKGIYTKSHSLRFYPFDNLASHILGFTSLDEGLIGRYGLELYFNGLLAGKDGKINNKDIIKPIDGENLILTIDRNIQAEGEKILKSLIAQYNADSGTVIVEEPKTGKILAMGSFPDFNPNNYSKFSIGTFLNPAVQAVYEPGSVFKLITMSAGIDSGKITPETTYIDTGSVTLNGKTIRNWDLKAHGEKTMTEVIENSINTGAVFIQQKTGKDVFYNYLVKFGLGELTDISLPGEVRGNLNNLKNDKDIDFATASFGQGVAVTPLEMINAVSAIANDGVLMKPIILANDKQEIIRRVISSDTSDKIAKMMASSVDKNILAAIPNYSVAGKTGTAFIPDFVNGGYTDDVINTFIGFTPAYNPRFVILIKLVRPEGNPLAGQTVVPAFRELTQFILNYYNVSPDRLIPDNNQS